MFFQITKSLENPEHFSALSFSTDPREQIDLFSNLLAIKGLDATSAKTGLLLALLRWRAQQDPLGYLQLHSKPGAQTATLATNHTDHLRGLDAEIRLQDDALVFG